MAGMSSTEDFRLRQLGRRLARVEKGLTDAHQRLARTFLQGKVSARRMVNHDWQVRLDLGRDAASGETVLSPWIPVQPLSAGGLKAKVKPSIGERFGLLSPSGVVGSGSWAVRGPFDQDHPAPAGEDDVVLEVGKSRLTIADGRIYATNGTVELELDGGNVRVRGNTRLTGDTLTHNDVNISSTHHHGGVERGGAVTDPPS